ncbi:hypothetical protein KDW_28180 [Dictyobacter vulcani]|uniref:Zinc-finger domain-containing protein n=1 Tax=Dictyobacter vulcani TaxID=2607529 RepID=A0A5J4KTX8_9CHLR|nr:hypothetical protein [Dictyobacter vulcani]GER88656.1 hypothetical protein KDW_28180 [Dictyobacter vulcani]
MSQLDRHLTTEQLSALLDDQVSEGEQADTYRAHLQTCEQCQSEFAELRQMVRLLQTLPPPTLPRSFALPANISAEDIEPATTPEREQEAPLPIPLAAGRARLQARRASRQSRPLQGALRMVSGLVAVVGICFMLSSVLSTLSLPHLAFTNSAASGTSSSSQAQPGNNQNGAAKTPQPGPIHASGTRPVPTRVSGVAPNAKPAPTPLQLCSQLRQQNRLMHLRHFPFLIYVIVLFG